MDLLKAELERKKQALLSKSQPLSSNGQGKKQYLRRGEIEQLKTNSSCPDDSLPGGIEVDSIASATSRPDAVVEQSDAKGAAISHMENHAHNEPTLTLSKQEVIGRLRKCGQPVTLFGETDKERLLRLQLWEEKNENPDLALGRGHDISSSFLLDSRRQPRVEGMGEVVNDFTRDQHENDAKPESKSNENSRKRTRPPGTLRSFDEFYEYLKRQVRKVNKDRPDNGDHELIGRIFESILEEAEHDLTCRSEIESRSAEGINYERIVLQTRDYLRPFFRLCRKRSLPKDILAKLKAIVDGLLDRNYREAGDAYIRLAVGNAPWLIGVSQVGLHERAARQKIYVGKIDHVMNDEEQRRYITSLKRLITFMQDKDIAVDDSKKLRS